MIRYDSSSAAPEDVDDLIFLNEPWTHSDR